jgi:hypothetical protein
VGVSASTPSGGKKHADSRLASLQQEVMNRIAATTAARREPRSGGTADRARVTGSKST